MAKGQDNTDVSKYFYFIKESVGSNWRDLALTLGFTGQADVGNITTKAADSKSQCMELLWEWQKRKGKEATIEALMEALLYARLRKPVDDLKKKYPELQGTSKKTEDCQRPAREDNGAGKKAKRKRKRRRKRKVEHQEDSSEESSLSVDKGDEADYTPSHNYFLLVAKAIGSSWVKLTVEQLGLNAQDVVNIQCQHPSSTEQQALQALELWRDRRGRKACRVKLAAALRRGGFRDIADELENDNGQGDDVDIKGPSAEKTADTPNNILQRTESPQAKRRRGNLEQTNSQNMQKPRTEPDSKDENEEPDTENTSLDEKSKMFYKLVDRCKVIFHEDVLADEEKFKMAVEGFTLHAKALIQNAHSNDHKLSTIAKVIIKRKADQEIARIERIFTEEVMKKTEQYLHFAQSFERLSATLRDIAPGCVLCYLEFENASCYNTFLSTYKDGSLSETLTQDLITDDMRAAEGEDLYVHVTLLGVDQECLDGSLSDEEHLGGNETCKTDIERPEIDADDTVTDASTDDKADDYFALLKLSTELFQPGIVQDPDKFEEVVTQFLEQAGFVIGTGKSELEGPKLGRKVKLRLRGRIHQHVKDVHEMAFTDKAFKDLHTYNRIVKCYARFSACLRKIERGCVLCYLDFNDTSCYETFLRAYRDGCLSAALTQDLITDDMRAAEGEDLYVHVTLLGVDGECLDDSLSDEEEPKDPTGRSQVGSAKSTFPDVFIKQGPLSPVKAEPTQDFPPCRYSKDSEDNMVSGGADAIRVKQEPAEQAPRSFMIGKVKSEMDTLEMEVKKESELDRQFCAVADHLGSMWERLASSLGFNTDYIRDLTARLPPIGRPHQLICDWMERNVGDVTLDQLVQALRDAGIHEVADAADSGQLFFDYEASKGKPDEDMDTGSHAALGTFRQSTVSRKKNKKIKREQLGQRQNRKRFKYESDYKTAYKTDNHQNGVTEDAKTTVKHTLLNIGEKVFDEETFQYPQESMERIASVISDTDDSESERHKLQSAVKLSIKKRINNKMAEAAERMFSEHVLDPNSMETFHNMAKCFKRFAASLKKAKHGCVLWHLNFSDVGCYDTFWRGYCDGRLSDTLTRELITDDMRAAEGGADLYIHVRVLDSATRDGDFSDQDEKLPSMWEFPDSSSSDSDSSSEEEGHQLQPDFNDQLIFIANKLGDNWTWLALQLGFSSTDIGRISRFYPPSCQANQCLEVWVQREQSGATMDAVLVGLRAAGLHHIADDIETDAQFQKKMNDRSWGSEWTGQSDKDDGSSSDGDTDYDGDSEFEGAAHKATSLCSTTHGKGKSIERLPEVTDSQTWAFGSRSSHGNMEGERFAQDYGSTSLDPESHSCKASLSMYPTGEDALAWNDCIQDFFKTDKDTTRVIQQSWPSNLLVKHLIRDRFFHSYLCEYWKQYQSFPDTLSDFVEFVAEMSAKQFSSQNGMSYENLKSFYADHCLMLGKAAFESHTNNQSKHVYKGQLEWSDIRQSSFGWLQPAYSGKPQSAFQFVHDSIRQFLMAVWVAHTVRTQTDGTELLRVCAEKSAHLPITCYCLAHLLGMTDSLQTYLFQFVTLLMQLQEGVTNFNCLSSIGTTIVESKQLGALSSLTQNLFHDKTLDLSALPEISLHGLHCLTQLISNTTLIQTIKLPDNTSFKDISKQYPFGRKRLTDTNHTNQIRYLSYLPLFECLPSKSSDKHASMTEISFTKTDQEIRVDKMQQYLQFGQSLLKLTVRSSTLTAGALGDVSKSLLFAPNISDLVIALKEVDSSDIEQVLVVLSCLHNLQHVEFTEYRCVKGCRLSVSWGTFTLQCKTRPNSWQGVFSFQPSHIRELVVDGSLRKRGNSAGGNRRNSLMALSAAYVAKLASAFPHLKRLIKLRFNSLKVRSSEWQTLFQGLASLPPTTSSVESSVADISPPLELLGFTNCDLTVKELLLLHRLLKSFRNVKVVDLSYNKVIDDETVAGLAEGLASFTNLNIVHLSSDNVSNKGMLLLLLRDQSRHLQVKITGSNISSDLTSLLEFRKDPGQVSKLDLSSKEYSWEHVTPLPITSVHLLLQFLPQLPNLQELELCVSCQGEEEAEHISQLYGVRHVLKKLKLKDWSLDNMIRLSTQMFQHLLLLEEIDFSDNVVSDEAVPEIAKGLGSCQNLKKVYLSENKLSDRVDFLPSLPNLEEIDLSKNAIGDEAVPSLAEGVVSCPKLKNVNLIQNKLSDVGELISTFINLPILTHVHIDNNSLSDESLPTVAAWLKVRTDVKEVGLCSNSFSAEGVIDFVRTIKGKAYRGFLNDTLLYDGSQSGDDEAVRWLPTETGVIDVRVRQLSVWIKHEGPSSNNAQLMSP